MKKLLLLLLLAVAFAIPRLSAQTPAFTEVNSYEELLSTPDGTLVSLNFPVRLNAAWNTLESSDENGYDFYLYTNAPEGNAIRISVKGSATAPLASYADVNNNIRAEPTCAMQFPRYSRVSL